MKNVTGNVYSRGINLHDRVYKTLDETMREESPNRFASFLRIFNASDYGIILNTNDTSDFKLDTSFVSFFPRDVVSTMVHAAPVGVTYSVQCYGSKNWLFWILTRTIIFCSGSIIVCCSRISTSKHWLLYYLSI